MRLCLDDSGPMRAIQARTDPAMVEKWRHTATLVKTSGEIRPGDLIPVIAQGRSGDIAVVPMKWGPVLIPASGQEPAVTRPEVPLEEFALRRSPWPRTRCAVPVSWYYAWDLAPHPRTGTLVPVPPRFLCQPVGEEIAYLAGVFVLEEGLPAFSVLMASPKKDQPVLLSRDTVRLWVDRSRDPAKMVFPAVPLLSEPDGDFV